MNDTRLHSGGQPGDGKGDVDFDAIRARIGGFKSIVEREWGVQLRKGRCACRFHDGQRPDSFAVNGEKARCFSCDWSGDVFDFVARCRGITAVEAARALDHHPGSNGKATRRSAAKPKGKGYQTAEDALRAYQGIGELTAHHFYTDADGAPVIAEGRFEPGDGPKTCRPIYVDPDGWHQGNLESDRPLYNLPEVVKSPLVIVCEGPKCAEIWKSLGFVATTSSHGAKSPHKTDWTPLSGKAEVVLSPDNDPEGEGYLNNVGSILAKLDRPPKFKVLRLPGLTGKGDDVEQWSELHDSWEPDRVKAELARLIAGAPEWKLAAEVNPLLVNYKPKTFGTIEKAIGKLEHLWPNMLILGGASMIWSKPKIGKTRFYIGLIEVLWNAWPWPDRVENKWPKGLKTLVCPYDRNHAEIANEMRLMGIPDEAAICPHDPRDPTGVSLVPLDDPLMIDIIRICLDDPAVKLIVIDTLTYASGKSLSKPEDMKAILDGIMELALQHHVAILLLIHENKEGEALGRRINERARVLMRLERYSEQDPTRLRLFAKEGNFPIKPAITVVHTDKGVVFEPDRGATGNAADKRNACANWLIEFFWDKGAGVRVDYGTLISVAGAAGFAGEWDEDTGRWKNPNLLSRAIKAINDKDHDLAKFHMFTIGRDEEDRPGRTKPVIRYWIEGNIPPLKINDGTV